MGAAFGNRCFPDMATAQDAYFQSAAPVFLPSGHTVSFQNQTGIWNRVETDSTGAVFSIASAPVPGLSACDSMQGFNDGLALSALLVVSLVTAAIFGIVSRAK